MEREYWRHRSGPVASLRGRRLYKRWMDDGVLQPHLNQRRRLWVCVCAFCKREGARECRRACVRSEEVLYRCMLKVQHVVGSVCLILHVMCVLRELELAAL